ncbi:MAG: hypothetical protein H0T76_25870 [Nannocystis sp.]|nr:hypothetical protein [Nannocystis sp.]MBA3549920.1 hypothetical protein [Nannocystis sp.]
MTLPAEDRERLLIALRQVDPAGFRGQLRAVLVAHEAVTSAARALGVSPQTLAAWIAEDPAIALGLCLEP